MISFLLLASHLCGDFLLQNHWMQRKSTNSLVCLVHVLFYSIPFLGLWALGWLPLWFAGAVVAEHYLQDRYKLHLKWMEWYGHTTPEKWAVGPLCVDQSMHLAFMGGLCLFL